MDDEKKPNNSMESANDKEETQKPVEKVVIPPELPLEWTKLGEQVDSSNSHPIRYPSDVMEFDVDQDYLEIIGTSGQKITHMGKDLMKQVSPSITHLIFRSHLITRMEGIKGLNKLEVLELYDNQVESLEELVDEDEEQSNWTGFNLKTLDMSYNVIRDMNPVKFCPNVVELYLANNKIKVISGLSNLTNLRKLDLGANRIRVMDETQLSGLVNLEDLWLGKNKIEKIEGLESLKKLRRLDVQSNRLTTIDGLTSQIDTLEELYLAHNGIDNEGAMKETGLMLQFTNLTTLDLSKNRLTSCGPFAHLDSLNELWLSSNQVSTFEDVEPISRLGMREGAELNEVYFEHNPIYEDFEYRKKLKEMIPSLNQIDANIIGATGYGSAMVQTSSPEAVIEKMRLLQDQAVNKAKEEAELKAK
mmetsp:Transcript_17099/g.19774  ORF Transcript_17099/g.19774 Transcript_17099/m.19774 type:complete len:417 (-) Transcript_17099:195-1445(-)